MPSTPWIACFRIVREPAGGLPLSTWREPRVWIAGVRIEQRNPRFGEWVQWLAERIGEREREVIPAHEAHADGWPPERKR